MWARQASRVAPSPVTVDRLPVRLRSGCGIRTVMGMERVSNLDVVGAETVSEEVLSAWSLVGRGAGLSTEH